MGERQDMFGRDCGIYHPEEVGRDCEGIPKKLAVIVVGHQDWTSRKSSRRGHVGMIRRTCGKTGLITNNQMGSVD